ncbi:hypothetical protein BV22DRAFT_1036366 [Leucogyrophana mollusca]|uniref:Uncharacterized protein n=1 Tax=Leucogyrophana mollusca TaxID=85980 RepID=A0ACB8BCJ4_9AGAM|nr:hypothetical protein BV22DRAFT_1036366 [Leucogyrophana mollusca]
MRRHVCEVTMTEKTSLLTTARGFFRLMALELTASVAYPHCQRDAFETFCYDCKAPQCSLSRRSNPITSTSMVITLIYLFRVSCKLPNFRYCVCYCSQHLVMCF